MRAGLPDDIVNRLRAHSAMQRVAQVAGHVTDADLDLCALGVLDVALPNPSVNLADRLFRHADLLPIRYRTIRRPGPARTETFRKAALRVGTTACLLSRPTTSSASHESLSQTRRRSSAQWSRSRQLPTVPTVRASRCGAPSPAATRPRPPPSMKWAPPRYQDIRAGNVALLSSHDGGALVRVIAGEVAGHAGPGTTHTSMTMLHATLSPGAELTIPWRPDFNALLYVLNGK